MAVREAGLSQVRNLTVAAADAGLRLDRWFRKHFPTLGHGRLEKLLRTGQVRVDGKRAKAGLRLQGGEVVRVPPLAEAASEDSRPAVPRAPSAPSESELRRLRDSLLYMDDWVIAIDKPAGLAVQGGSGQKTHLDAMLDGLRFEAAERPRLVHRLDKDTSGVLLLARSRQAAQALAAAFKSQKTHKLYWAAVAGVPRPPHGRIDLPLGKQARGPKEQVAAGGLEGQPAVTLYAVADRADRAASWLVLRPLTGRTHQLRVHCAAIGHPILGDGKYGGKAAFLSGRPEIKQLQLHARQIALPHPADGTTLRITAPLPAHMERAWTLLAFDAALGEPAADSLEG